MNIIGLCALAIGLFQMAVITLGLEYWLGIHWAFTLILAVPVAMVPFVSTATAIYSAMLVWHWSLIKACTVFLTPIITVMAVIMLRKWFARPPQP